jgi:uncharacterized membrane protein
VSTPIHPAIVHVPLGLSFAIPIVALAALLWFWRGRSVTAVWLVVILLQCMVVGGALVALRTGEADEERVERIVGERPLETHESASKQFLAIAAASLLVSIIVLVPRVSRRGALIAAVVATLVTAGMAVRAGHSGGEVVYVHGGARAHIAPSAGAGREGTAEHEGQEAGH